jgi:lysophospholipase L1-like esterase
VTQPVQRFVLRRRDRIVFLGDSITEQQLYTNYVESYLATRYPELELTFFNAGWGGDTAPGGVARLQRDVLALKPSVVTLCYGMNDGRYTQPTEEIRQTFVNGLRELVRRLKRAGIRIVLLTPGMVDEHAAPHLAPVEYNRRGLRVLVDEVLRLAVEQKLPHYDLHLLMNEVDARARAADPTFTMIPDGVHPNPAGHLVMAYGLLQALGVPPRQQEITVDLPRRRVAASPGLKAGRLQTSPHGFTLEIQLDRLPFFVEPAARKVLPFLPFQETFNELRFTVKGLASDRAYFRSELMRSAPVPSAEFAKGLNLFSAWATAPVRAAEAVHRYTFEKDQIYFKIWRILALNGVNSPFHNAAAHEAGIRMGPNLDAGRRCLLDRDALRVRLNVVATDLPGEPLMEGDFITQWSFLGPFPKPYETDKLGGEAAFTKSVPKLTGPWLAWDLNPANAGNALIEILGTHTDCFAYAVTVVDSPVAQNAELRLGSDDGFAVWLNGKHVAANLALARGVIIDQERLPVRLRKGRNVLLLKISQGMGNWGFCARFGKLRKPVSARRPPNA